MKILSVGYALPSKKVTNEDILREVDKNSGKYLSEKDLAKLKFKIADLFKKAGTDVRYHRAEGENSLDFAIKAGNDALKKANLSPKDIDILLYVGVGRGWIEPATCNVLLDTLKLKNATGYDILDACASWLRALQVAYLYTKSGTYKNVMIMNCEFNAREYTSTECRAYQEIDYLFPGLTIGEAATATIFTQCPGNDFYFTFKTWGEKHNLCKIPLPNLDQFTTGELTKTEPLRFYSHGEKLFKFALPKICRHYLGDEYLKKFQYDIIFSHAASDPMTEKVIRLSNLDIKKAYNIHAKYGNTVSASVPLAMGLAIDDGTLKKDHNVLIGFGSAGFTSAWCSFQNK
ncbi:MAG TPA: 3-oxoacyl-[acyl-carrier-protein] synthase III C-terminal domain-containing protein [Candidatus Eremiobacteraeota bacterium]|nr:MAG: 3-oxoacyl-(acyl-carrier-protein) synthase 3 [bacterium ADurb.Bin363]HPZ10304.1 3-oxoacyl-[acyl-carrier-protein] synthase III C-terminal domain-containing protein [Candidatus Eremiobacteraeota bacterium]